MKMIQSKFLQKRKKNYERLTAYAMYETINVNLFSIENIYCPVTCLEIVILFEFPTIKIEIVKIMCHEHTEKYE